MRVCAYMRVSICAGVTRVLPGLPPCLASFTYSESVSLIQYLLAPSVAWSCESPKLLSPGIWDAGGAPTAFSERLAGRW